MFRNLLASMVVTLLATTLGIIVDGIVIGKFLGVRSVAAYGIAGPVILILLAISGIFTSGTQNMCAGEMGRGNVKNANEIYSVACIITVSFCTILSILINIFINPICRMLGATGNAAYLIHDVAAYIRGLSFMIPGMMLALLIVNIRQLEGDNLTAVFGTVSMTAVNIGLDLFNVYVLKWGLSGMAIATTISYYTGLAVVLLRVCLGKKTYKFRFVKIKWGIVSKIFKIGTPGAVEKFCLAIRIMMFNRILVLVAGTKIMGSLAVAALSVQYSINNFFGVIAMGVAMSVLSVTGVFFGEENKPALRRLLKESFKTGIILTSLSATILFIFCPHFVGIFTSNRAAQHIAINGVRLYCLSMPIDCVNSIMKSYLQGIRRAKTTYVFAVTEILFISIGCAFLLGKSVGIYGVFATYFTAETITFIVLVIFIMIRDRTFRIRLDNFLFLKKNFDVASYNVYEGSAGTMDEVIELSRQTEKFCIEHGADEKSAGILALSVKEMAGNIIKHGFSDGQEHHMDYRVIYKNGEYILRLRDDCKMFNPVEWLKAADDSKADGADMETGIKKVKKLAKDIRYVNSMNTNTLIVKV